MKRTSTGRFLWFVGLVAFILLLGRFGEDFLSRLSLPEAPRSDPADWSVDPEGALSSEELLLKLQSDKRLINVHEHMESLNEAPLLLRVMDAHGVKKSVLMGSSWFTITMDERVGFTRYDENNEELLRIVAAYPGRFEAWPTIDPQDADKLDKFKSLHERGASGLKLYLGHGFVKRSDGDFMFHTMAMDDPSMFPLYAYCEENFVPICFHVQPSFKGPGFAEEFVAVLEHFPDLKIICPHFMLSSIKDSRLREYLDTFPNLYSDISFGYDTFLIEGLKRISDDPDKFRGIFREYPDRFLWGTDLVITAHASKTETWTSERFRSYLDMLTQETYTTPVMPGKVLNGLSLNGELLERILYRNFEELVVKRPKGTRITRRIDWSNMGVKQTGRVQGQVFPPPSNER